MPYTQSPGYDPSRTEGALEPTLPDPPGAPPRLPSFGSFFGFFGNTTVPNTPSARSAASSPTPTPTTPNRRIRRAIARLNRQERREEQEREERAAERIQRRRRLEESNARALIPYSLRCTIKGLYRYPEEPVSRIAALVKQPYTTVHRIVHEAQTPTRGGYQNGLIYDSPIRHRLVDFIESNTWARRLTYSELSFHVGVPCSDSTVARYLKKEGFRRCVAQAKPWLTAAHRRARLAFALAYSHFQAKDWWRVMWTDEAAMHRGGHQRIYVFRRPGERFNPACLRPQFSNITHTMVWAAFCGVENGHLLFWNREEWGNITAQGFLDHIYPKLKEFYDFYNVEYAAYFPNHEFGTTPTIVQMDNATCHRARITIAQFQGDNIELFDWPANSPDLNLIEGVWNLEGEDEHTR